MAQLTPLSSQGEHGGRAESLADDPDDRVSEVDSLYKASVNEDLGSALDVLGNRLVAEMNVPLLPSAQLPFRGAEQAPVDGELQVSGRASPVNDRRSDGGISQCWECEISGGCLKCELSYSPIPWNWTQKTLNDVSPSCENSVQYRDANACVHRLVGDEVDGHGRGEVIDNFW